MKIIALALFVAAIVNCRHVHESVVGPIGGSTWNPSGSAVWPNGGSNIWPNGGSGIRPGPAPNMGGSWGPSPNPWGPGGSTIRPNPWNPNPNPNPWSPGGSTFGGSTSMNGVSCMNGVPRSLGQAYYAGPTRMSCTAGYSDICTSLQQCAALMCSKYIRCPGSISYTRA